MLQTKSFLSLVPVALDLALSPIHDQLLLQEFMGVGDLPLYLIWLRICLGRNPGLAALSGSVVLFLGLRLSLAGDLDLDLPLALSLAFGTAVFSALALSTSSTNCLFPTQALT